jgi:hypothetical protein
MSVKGILFIGLFLFCSVGAVFLPQLGIYGYMADYGIGPAGQWWEAPISGLKIRYSLTLAMATALGIFLQRRKLYYGEKFLHKQETLILLFLAIVLLSHMLGAETIGRYSVSDTPLIKMGKLVIFMFMMTHVITDRTKLNGLVWTLVLVSLVLGLQAWDTPLRAFTSGRLENLGGADFSDANRFGGFMAGMLFLIGAQFLRSEWKGKLLCLVSGAFTANAVILTRSRGAFLGLVVGMIVAGVLAPRKYRVTIVAGIILAGVGFLSLTDSQFLKRASSISSNVEQSDYSARSRIEIWKGGLKMLLDNPVVGVGPGNFYQYIGHYQPMHPDRDAHNTLVRSGGELGFSGLIVLLLIIGNAFRMYLDCMKAATRLPPEASKDVLWLSFGGMTALAAILAYGMTGTLVYTEYFWWMLALPVCINRVVDNELSTLDG